MLDSLIRTYIPVWVSAALVWLAARFDIVLDSDTSVAVSVAAVGLVLAVYYALARFIELRWPALGRILIALGLTRGTPEYRDDQPLTLR
ncbi:MULTISPECIES: hypothetical protein [Actinocorallia]|uniref:Uncharacterized protein n=2 Tax=Actinocorallia TaxID=58108 RepID=A0ABN3URY8_9ACTN